MRPLPPGYGSMPSSIRRSNAARDVDRALRVPEPQQPGETEWFWIAAALSVIAGLIIVDYLFSGGLTAPYFTGMIVLTVVMLILANLKVSVVAARVLALLISVALVGLVWWSGIALSTAEAASPAAQALQDGPNGVDNVGNMINGLVPLGILVGLVFAIGFWFTKKPWMIIVSGLLLPLALYPVVGLIAQELAKHPWH